MGGAQTAVAVAVVVPCALALLKAGDVDLENWTEADFRLGKEFGRQNFTIEMLSNVRRPGMMESLPMTPTSQGRVKMIEQCHPSISDLEQRLKQATDRGRSSCLARSADWV